MWAIFALILACSSGLVSSKNSTDFLFNGNGKIVLSLSKGFKVQILSQNEVKGTFNLPEASKAKVKGTNVKDDFTLDIDYSGTDIKGDTGTLSGAKFSFVVAYNKSTG